jgi:hypothetical protein
MFGLVLCFAFAVDICAHLATNPVQPALLHTHGPSIYFLMFSESSQLQ